MLATLFACLVLAHPLHVGDEVAIRLVFADGTPAAGLAVYGSAFEGRRAGHEVRTDDEGRAVLSGVSVGPLAPAVWIDLVAHHADRIAVPHEHLAVGGREPRAFVVPDFGFVEVEEVVLPSGDGSSGALLATTEAAPTFIPFHRGRSLPLASPWRIAVATGETGERFRVYLEAPGASNHPFVEVARPTARGEVRSERLVFAAGGLTITARPMIERRSPGDRLVWFELAPQTSWFERHRLAADTRLTGSIIASELDEIRIDLGRAWRDVAFDLVLWASQERYARVTVDPRGAPHVDVGAIELGPMPLLVSGRVVDEAGAPLAGAFVEDVLADVFCMETPFAVTDAEGRFELRGKPADFGDYHVLAHGRVSVAVPLDGAPDVVAVAPLAGVVAGSLGAADVLAASRGFVVLRCVPADEHAASIPRNREPILTAVAGEWEFAGLAPGLWDVELLVTGAVVDRIEGIEVGPGETTRDPRLDPVDLSRVRVQTVRVRRAGGVWPTPTMSPAALGLTRPAEVGVRPVGAAPSVPWTWRSLARDADESFLVPVGEVDVRLRGGGLVPLAARSEGEPVEFTAVPSAPVRLRLARPDLPSFVGLDAWLEPVPAPADWTPHDGELVHLADGSWLGVAPGAGPHRARFALVLEGVRVDVEDPAARVFSLDPAAAQNEHTVTLDPRAVAAALERLAAHDGSPTAR